MIDLTSYILRAIVRIFMAAAMLQNGLSAPLEALRDAASCSRCSTAQPPHQPHMGKQSHGCDMLLACQRYGHKCMYLFLHCRTAGRTFHSCLLRPGTPGSKRCPKAYDHLRIDFSVPQCYLLSSHDDFSVVEQLPDNTAVVSQLRDPIDRFLSSYEFAIEVAARQLRRSKSYVKPKNRVVTDDVWPWSHLIPFFVDDLKPKVAAAKAQPLEAPGKLETLSSSTLYNRSTHEVKNTSSTPALPFIGKAPSLCELYSPNSRCEFRLLGQRELEQQQQLQYCPATRLLLAMVQLNHQALVCNDHLQGYGLSSDQMMAGSTTGISTSTHPNGL